MTSGKRRARIGWYALWTLCPSTRSRAQPLRFNRLRADQPWSDQHGNWTGLESPQGRPTPIHLQGCGTGEADPPQRVCALGCCQDPRLGPTTPLALPELFFLPSYRTAFLLVPPTCHVFSPLGSLHTLLSLPLMHSPAFWFR